MRSPEGSFTQYGPGPSSAPCNWPCASTVNFTQQSQRFKVHRQLGQPQALGLVPKAVLERHQPPLHLQLLVALAQERQDGVVRGLRQPVADAVLGMVGLVRLDDLLI